jgi:hypothetical protein
MELLPIDILAEILSYLSIRQLADFRLVAKKISNTNVKCILNRACYLKYILLTKPVCYNNENYFNLFISLKTGKFNTYLRNKLFDIEKVCRQQKIINLRSILHYVSINLDIIYLKKYQKFKDAIYDKIIEIYIDSYDKKVKKMCCHYMWKIFHKNIPNK